MVSMFDTFPYLFILPPEFASALLAALPITELRAALPIALTIFHLDPIVAFLATFIGNLIPLVLIFALLPGIIQFAEKHSPWLHRILEKYFRRLANKHTAAFQRYGTLALLVFVAVPLPGSGVWTGSVLAILFGIRRDRAILAIVAGLFCAGVLVLLITQGTVEALPFLL